MAKTGAGVELNNKTASTKTGTQSTTGTKNMRPVLKCLFTMARMCRNVARGCVTFQRRDYQWKEDKYMTLQ